MKSQLRQVANLILQRRAYKFILKEFLGTEDLDGLSEVLACTRQLRAITPLLMEVPRGRRVLVIAPHEDDEMIGPGGTVIRMIRKGVSVRVLYLTERHDDMAASRRSETLSVSAQVGYETEFLGFPSGALRVGEGSARRVARALEAYRPDVVMLPFLSDDHADHRAASGLLMKAAHDGHLRTKPEVWAYQVYSALLANVAVDITDLAEEKASAIRTWKSTAMRSRDWAHYALGLNAYNCRLLRNENRPRLVEAFFVLPLDAYVELCRRYYRN